MGGGELGKIDKIDYSNLDKRILQTMIIAASDVDSPLTGKNGASYVFGPQKGASPDMVKKLDNNLTHFANIIQKTYNVSIADFKGGGAAGGLGAGLHIFLKAEIKSGFTTIAKLIGLEEKIKNSNIIITAEGKVDDQTVTGKTPAGVGLLAIKYNKPVFVFTGNASNSTDVLSNYGISCLVPITRKPVTIEKAIANTPTWLQKSAEDLCRTLEVGYRLTLNQ